MTQSESFGAWVRRRRKLLDMTQDELASSASLSVSAIRKVESDERRPSRESAELLAVALRVDLAERKRFLQLARAIGEQSLAPSSHVHNGAATPAYPASDEHSHSTATHDEPIFDGPMIDTISARPLPVPALPIVGRGFEVSQIRRLLDDPQCRLLTIVGPGGIGKTRLALEVAHQIVGHYRDGASYVELAPLNSAANIPAAIATSLGIDRANNADPAAAVADYLARRNLLLILDNMEHLLDGAEFVAELLLAAPDLTIVVTSREHLSLSGEWTFELQGLPVREVSAKESTAKESAARESAASDAGDTEAAAVVLFVQRAHQADLSFTLDATQRDAINRLCTLLGGMPLAIELAASWVRVLSPAEILDEISRNLDFLASSRRDLPLRHRSLRAVFDQSWAMLGDQEQRTLRRVSLFRTSFTRDAVKQVADGGLGEISALVAKSLINHGVSDGAGTGLTSGRFRVHEMVRQFARLQLEEAGEADATHRRMLDYYVGFCEHGRNTATGDNYVRWNATLQTEFDNLREILEWGFMHEPVPSLRLFCFLRHLWEQRSATEASAWMTRALTVCDATSDVPADLHALVLGLAARVDLDHEQAAQRAEKSVALARAAGSDRLVANVLPLLGHAAIRMGHPEEAARHFQEALDIAEMHENLALEAYIRNEFGKAERYLGNYASALQHHQRALEAARVAGQPELQADATLNLNLLAMRTGDFLRARAWIEENIALARAIGDRPSIGWALQSLVRCNVLMGEYERAEILIKQVATFVAETPYRNQPENYLLLAGDLHLLRGELDLAEPAYRKCLKTAQDPLYCGWSLRCLGVIYRYRGDWDRATEYLMDAVALSDSTNERWNRGLTFIILADVYHEQAMMAESLSYQKLSGQILAALEDKWGLARWCETAARIAQHLGQDARAAIYIGAADSLRLRTGARLSIIETPRNASQRAELMDMLGKENYAAHIVQGEMLSGNMQALVDF